MDATPIRKGAYRDADGVVWLVDGGFEVPIAKTVYIERGLRPPYAKLPTKEEFDAGERPTPQRKK